MFQGSSVPPVREITALDSFPKTMHATDEDGKDS
jgi:hypothetical protein